MKKNILILSVLSIFACQEEPKKCACLGYDNNNQITEVICNDCESGIKKNTCDEYNKQNLNNLTWQYDEGEVCKIVEPNMPSN